MKEIKFDLEYEALFPEEPVGYQQIPKPPSRGRKYGSKNIITDPCKWCGKSLKGALAYHDDCLIQKLKCRQ